MIHAHEQDAHADHSLSGVLRAATCVASLTPVTQLQQEVLARVHSASPHSLLDVKFKSRRAGGCVPAGGWQSTEDTMARALQHHLVSLSISHVCTYTGRLRSESLFISLLSDGGLTTFTAPPELSSLITSEALVALALKGGQRPGGGGGAKEAGEPMGRAQVAGSPGSTQQEGSRSAASTQPSPMAEQQVMAAGGMRLSVTEEVRLSDCTV